MRYESQPNPERWPHALEGRLRALPPPPVPAGLESRLLAAIPTSKVNVHRPWAVLVGAVAAACFMVVLLFARRADNTPDRGRVAGPLARQDAPSRSDEFARIAEALKARRELNEAKLPPFNWPLASRPPTRLSASISGNSLD